METPLALTQARLRFVLRLILTLVLSGAGILSYRFYRFASLSPAGPLAGYVPVEMDVFFEVKGLREGLRSLEASKEWKALAASGRVDRARGTQFFRALQEKIHGMEKAIPMDLKRGKILALFGQEGGLALRWCSTLGRPDWLLLTRTEMNLADLSWAGSFYSNCPTRYYRDVTILEIQRQPQNLFVAAVGDLLLISNQRSLLEASMDLVLGQGAASFAALAPKKWQAAAGPPIPSLSTLVNLRRLLGTRGPENETEGPSPGSLLGNLRDRLNDLSIPAELAGITSIFLSNKVELLERAKYLGVSATFDGRWVLEGDITLDTAWSPQISQPTLSMQECIPDNIAYVGVSFLDFRQWFKKLMEEETQDRVAIADEVFQYCDFLGIKDFDREFLGLFGPEVGLLLAPQQPWGEGWIYPLPALAVVIQLRSPSEIAGFLKKSVDRMMADMHADHAKMQAELPPEQRGDFPFEIQELDVNGCRIYRVELRKNDLGRALSPAYGIIGHYLVITSSFRFLEELVEACEPTGKKLAQRRAFQKWVAKQDAPVSRLWYINPPHLAEALLPVATSYVDTHKYWSAGKKEDLNARLTDIASLLNLFGSAVFTSRQESGRIRVEGIVWFGGE